MDRVLSARSPVTDHSETASRAAAKNDRKSPPSKNVKFTISLSPRSAEALEEIRHMTDAATDSEVFRNALRLHLMLLRAHADGKTLVVKDDKDGGRETAISLIPLP